MSTTSTNVVMVTVTGDRGSEDFAVPVDVPIRHLVGEWADRCASGSPERLCVTRDSELVGNDLTLAEAGVCFGTELRLVDQAADVSGVEDVTDPNMPAIEAGPAEPAPVLEDLVPRMPVDPTSTDPEPGRGWEPEVLQGGEAPINIGHVAGSRTGGRTPVAALSGGAGGLPRRVAAPVRVGHAVRAVLAPGTSAEPVADYVKASRPGARERARQALASTNRPHNLEQIIRQAHLGACNVIAVVSPKGGPGKTTISALLSTLLAELRRDPVIAVDANPHFGDLVDKFTYDLDDRWLVDSFATWLAANPGAAPQQVMERLGYGPHGVRFLATPRPPLGSGERMRAAADYDLYYGLIETLRSYAGIVILDCGTGLFDPPVRAALEQADQIVLVTNAEASTARQVVPASEMLRRGVPRWLVANKMVRNPDVDLPKVQTDIGELMATVTVRVPKQGVSIVAGSATEHIVTPSFHWDAAPDVWVEPLLELGASLAQHWIRS